MNESHAKLYWRIRIVLEFVKTALWAVLQIAWHSWI